MIQSTIVRRTEPIKNFLLPTSVFDIPCSTFCGSATMNSPKSVALGASPRFDGGACESIAWPTYRFPFDGTTNAQHDYDPIDADSRHRTYNKAIPMSCIANGIADNHRWKRPVSTRFAMASRILRSPKVASNAERRMGVTIVEVLFAMFVVLFGLVGLVVLLPMAGRQASDSYAMNHASATMDNSVAEFFSSKMYEPTTTRPWWFHDDEYATAPIANQGFGFSYDSQRRWYRSASTMQELLWFVQQRLLPAPTAMPPYYSSLQLELARRNGRAQGYCLDPQFCASELAEAWRYSLPYQHGRQAANQGVFRRSRMPFFDETTILGTGNSYIMSAGDFYPKLIRVSFAAGTTTARTWVPLEPMPLSKQQAMIVATSLGDINTADAVEDKSFGALRYFATGGGGLISSPTTSRVSWLATMTPSEQSPPDQNPTEFNLSLVMFNSRDNMFDAAPLPVTGNEKFAENEKMCFATSVTATSPALGNLGDLAFSFGGGTVEVQLWSDPLTDTTIRVGDWVMLSRRIVLGSAAGNIDSLHVIHRHSWYRVIGTDISEVWPRQVRLAGEPWDYPEMNAIMNPQGNYASVVPSLTNIIYSSDRLSSVPGPSGSVTGPAMLSLGDLATTATIFRNVVGVYKRIVTLE